MIKSVINGHIFLGEFSDINFNDNGNILPIEFVSHSKLLLGMLEYMIRNKFIAKKYIVNIR